MKNLELGTKVNYVWSDGKCYNAKVVHIWNQDKTVVDLSVFISEEIPDLRVSTVLYFHDHAVNTWHWIEKEK